MSRRIHTFTANLLWETTFYVDSWQPGRTARATHEAVQVGGKGINVSKMLNRLGAPNEAICFPGGFSGARCVAWLEDRQFALRPFATSRETRTGQVIRSAAHPETAFLGTDNPLDAEAIASCCEYLSGLPEGDILVINGSIPGWDQERYDVFRSTLSSLAERLFVAVDTYGPPLAWFAGQPVNLIKVNQREFSALGPGDDASPNAERLADLRPAAWIVTDGSRQVSGYDPDGGAWVKNPPAVQPVSPVGSGDIFLAALLHAHVNHGLPWDQAADEAIPPAAANAATPGIADYPDELAESLRQEYRQVST